MPILDAVFMIHGTGTSAYGTPNTGGDDLGHSGSEYSALELDLGAGFPGFVEAAYTAPNTRPGFGGVSWGLHVVVGEVFNTLTTLTFDVCTSAATAALYNAAPNPIAARTLYLAELLAGAHFFIPVPTGAVRRYNRFYAVVGGSNPSTGQVWSWFGPPVGGEQ